MRIASIDIGSNTVLLLIADVNKENRLLSPIINLYRMPRISKGLNENGNIKESSIDGLFNVLSEYSTKIKQYKCDHIIVNATQALRVANNSKEIIESIYLNYDLNVNIIPGDREAFLSFLGAQSSFKSIDETIVIDIGGASTEIICGVNSEISFQKSFPIGVVTMTEKYSLDSVVNHDVIGMEKFLLDQFQEIRSIDSSNTIIIAVAGTPTTLAAAMQNLDDFSESRVEGFKLKQVDLRNFIQSFLPLSPDEIRNKFGKIIEGRQDIILAGTLILSTIMKLLEKEYLYSSGRGLRYGAVIDYINSTYKGL